MQTAYQITAATSEAHLDREQPNLWDSGRVESSACVHVPYAGELPADGNPLFWRVRTFDSDGLASPWSDVARISFARPKADGWHAQFIAPSSSGSRHIGAPASLLKCDIDILRPLVSARLSLAVAGLCRLFCNGQAVADGAVFGVPADYRHALSSEVVDLAKHLVPGRNRLVILLADGAACGSIDGLRERYLRQPCVRAQLDLGYASGGRQWVITDNRWSWRASHVLSAEPEVGEIQDCRQFDAELFLADSQDKGFQPVRTLPSSFVSGLTMHSRAAPSPTVLSNLPAVSRSRVGATTVFDFGELLRGRGVLQAMCADGDAISVRYRRRLDDPEFTQDQFSTAANADWQRLSGLFSEHEFRYLEVSGLSDSDLIDVTADVVGLAQSFDNELLFDAQALTELAEAATHISSLSLQSLPLDSRGKAGLDTLVLALRGLMYSEDIAGYLLDWQPNLFAAARETGLPGRIAPVIPGLSAEAEDVAVASDAMVILPWTLYRCCGHLENLAQHFDAMARFVRVVEQRSSGCIREAGPEDNLGPVLLDSDCRSRVGRDLIATAFFYYDASLVARAAAVLGRAAEFEYFEALAEKIRRAFSRRFVSPDGHLVDDSIDAAVVTLHLGLLSSEQRDRVRLDLLARINEKPADALTTPLAMAYLLPVLTAMDRLDVAYSLACPSAHGVTAVTRADVNRSSPASRRDQASGSLVQAAFLEWLYSCVVGIDLDPDIAPARAGFARARLRPRPPLGLHYRDGPPVTRVEASMASVHGRFELGWTISEDAFEVRALVPSGCSAELIMPDGARFELTSGRHTRSVSLAADTDGIPVLSEVQDIA
ncbi:MAG: alpha-L-rhamnosidase N-terminal domain-containing protein [Pseudomonadaceae bacterium]|nr:alpha-L-rhamnosidase N-terminal domain-containing protein [Pseudomonadaceae bacterium]